MSNCVWTFLVVWLVTEPPVGGRRRSCDSLWRWCAGGGVLCHPSGLAESFVFVNRWSGHKVLNQIRMYTNLPFILAWNRRRSSKKHSLCELKSLFIWRKYTWDIYNDVIKYCYNGTRTKHYVASESKSPFRDAVKIEMDSTFVFYYSRKGGLFRPLVAVFHFICAQCLNFRIS